MAKVLRSYSISSDGKFKFPLNGWGKNGFTITAVHINLIFAPATMVRAAKQGIAGVMQTNPAALQIPFEFQLEVDQLWNSQSIAEQFVVSTPQLTTETDIEYLNKLTVITLDIPNTNGKPSQKATAGFVNFPDTEYWKTVASKSAGKAIDDRERVTFRNYTPVSLYWTLSTGRTIKTEWFIAHFDVNDYRSNISLTKNEIRTQSFPIEWNEDIELTLHYTHSHDTVSLESIRGTSISLVIELL